MALLYSFKGHLRLSFLFSSVLTTLNVPPLSQTQSESYIKSYFHEFGKSLNNEVRNGDLEKCIKKRVRQFNMFQLTSNSLIRGLSINDA